MVKLLVLVLAVLLVKVIADHKEIWDYHTYYFNSAMAFFIIVLVSSLFAYIKKSIVLWGYAFFNYFGLILFTLMINVKYFTLISNVVYDNDLSFSLILTCYEFLLLCSGFFDAFIFLYSVWSDAGHRCYSIENMFKSYNR